KVTIDINHPLAGKELTFSVKVVGVNDPEEAKDEKKDDDGCKPDDCSSCCGCN
ncbi:peptidylprolyl isomerase, partial [Candidatus Woesearchaeota archaeon]|nr:peptidylprolyl isomerase [Candidatus Woesearchaeota archaeon]